MSFGASLNLVLELQLLPKICIPGLNNTGGKVLICAFLLIAAFLVVRAYDKGSTGVKIFDWVLKIMVGIVVISFFGVVIKLSTSGQANGEAKLLDSFQIFLSLTSPDDTYLPFSRKNR